MKILHFLFELVSGGAERFVVDLANSQADMGHDVTVCILRPLNEKSGFCRQFLTPKVKFHCLGIERGISLGKTNAVRDYLLAEHPDVLHCHHNILLYLVSYLCGRNKPVIVHTIHSSAKRSVKNLAEKLYCQFLYKHSLIHPITISDECRRSFQKVFHLDAPCINNGRGAISPSADNELVQSEIENYKTSPSTLVFVHVGRFYPVKNQALLIDAFNELEREGTDFTLLVIGASFDVGDGALLADRACERIHFLGEKKNVGDYLMNSDAFCLTSWSEGLPISLIEAIQCGATPVCTPAGGVTDVIRDSQTGYLSSGFSLSSYMDALHRFIANPIDSSVLKRHYRDRFSMDACSADYQAYYQQLLK